MLNSRNGTFPHRHNHDGSFDSICRICYATLARSMDEASLQPYESNHQCEWRDLVMLLAQEPRKSTQGLFLVPRPIWSEAVDPKGQKSSSQLHPETERRLH
jgi:hypothetical protein